jgi:hypothetical protein
MQAEPAYKLHGSQCECFASGIDAVVFIPEAHRVVAHINCRSAMIADGDLVDVLPRYSITLCTPLKCCFANTTQGCLKQYSSTGFGDRIGEVTGRLMVTGH